MIDFIKIYTENKENLEANLKRNYSDVLCTLNYYTGEVQYPCRKYFENIEVRFTDKKAVVRNSLHKFFNIKTGLGSNNHTDFNYNDIVNASEILERDVNENFDEYKVTNLEFGLNINVSSDPKILLKNNFVLFNFDDYSQIDTFRGRGYYKQYDRREYIFKMYDKGLHSNLTDNILRIELKIIDSKLLKKIGVYTFKDIRKKEILSELFNYFIKRFDEVNVIDGFSGQTIPQKDKAFIELGKSSSFWRGVKSDKSSTYYYNLRKKYNCLLEKFQLLNVKKELKKLLMEKFDILIESIN